MAKGAGWLRGRCRRAFIDIGGGIADDMYRGEGVLYDFASNREIVRDKGDPSTDFESYGQGKGLPAFCDPADAAAYARDLLASIKGTSP